MPKKELASNAYISIFMGSFAFPFV